LTFDNYSNDVFLSCDWGTTSFRLNLVDIKTCLSITGIEDKDGIKNLNKFCTKKNPTSARKDFLLQVLNKKVQVLERKSGQNLKNIPVVISGMASSSIGIQEVAYATLPLLLDNPELQSVIINRNKRFQHNLILISGVRSQNDIMRGEETQLIGLIEKYKLRDGLCILPGTHSKHLFLKEGKLVGFKTYMTGELFELISLESILRNSVSQPSEKFDENDDSFIAGVQKARDGNFLHSLFIIRANDLLYQTSHYSNHNFLSGLLIGTELKNVSKSSQETIILSGDKQLHAYYSAAMNYLNIPYTSDQRPNNLIFRGHRIVLKSIQ
jgi:2-dehydro-3-deoxygalactonokinase